LLLTNQGQKLKQVETGKSTFKIFNENLDKSSQVRALMPNLIH
jgi:hypothetical protein